ncbi:MAG: hypothetical protein PHV68_01845 [Candidatus Gastranaerophilales bacterium]|nr:hypothetical protein [Candidatus Gastranaerophilales bacterium]
MSNLQKFCELIRKRSEEHSKSILILNKENLYGQMISILRQELDSMVRVIFLLTQNLETRNKLMALTLDGEKWKLGKSQITDRAIVNATQKLHGWADSVYKFGCGFIHLSIFHDYSKSDPFLYLGEDEISNIKQHMIRYHNFPVGSNISIETLSPYLIAIFEKIKGNLECYIEDLEEESVESLIL